MRSGRGALAAGCVLFAYASPGHADTPTWDPGRRTTDSLRGEVQREDNASSDGVYGRFDGDISFSLGLGAELGDGTRGVVAGRALYYHTGGLVLGYADALGTDSDLVRALFFEAELRPLFLLRWSNDAQLGVPVLDLTLDSLALGVGGYAGAYEGGYLGDVGGFQASAGFGVPLLGRAEGPWLEARGTYRFGLPETNAGAVLLLSWYEAWVSPFIR